MTLNAELLASLPYAVEVVPTVDTEGNTVYLASNPELRGCMAHGDSPDEAIVNLAEARELYLSSLIEDGVAPPLPAAVKTGGRPFSAVWTSTTVVSVNTIAPTRRVVEQIGGPRMELATA